MVAPGRLVPTSFALASHTNTHPYSLEAALLPVAVFVSLDGNHFPLVSKTSPSSRKFSSGVRAAESENENCKFIADGFPLFVSYRFCFVALAR